MQPELCKIIIIPIVYNHIVNKDLDGTMCGDECITPYN